MTSADTKVMRWLGIVFLVFTGGLLFQELELEATWLVVAVSTLAALATIKEAKGEVPWLFPVGMVGTLSISVLAWMLTKNPFQLIGVGASIVALGVVASRTKQLWATSLHGALTEKGRLPALVTWVGLALGLTALIGGGYFHLFTERIDNEARRLVLSFSWILLSLALLVFSQAKNQVAARDAGFLVLAIACSKILLYDSTHLNGFLRIGVFGVAGMMLYFFGLMQQRQVVKS